MDETKEVAEEKKSEVSDGDNDAGDKSEADKKIKALNADTERINEAIAENENAKAREKLGGGSAGKVEVKPKSESEKKKEQGQEFFKGTALGDAIEKANE